jgi:hypothetical protein
MLFDFKSLKPFEFFIFLNNPSSDIGIGNVSLEINLHE